MILFFFDREQLRKKAEEDLKENINVIRRNLTGKKDGILNNKYSYLWLPKYIKTLLVRMNLGGFYRKEIENLLFYFFL